MLLARCCCLQPPRRFPSSGSPTSAASGEFWLGGLPNESVGQVLTVRLFSQLMGHERKAALQPGRLGLAAIAIGGGMGSALLVRAC